MKKIRNVLFCFVLLSFSALLAENLQYRSVRTVGRVGESEDGHPVLYWPGSFVEARFQGSSLSVVLNDEKGQAYYNVILDRDDSSPTVIKMKPGTNTYVIATNLVNSIHEVMLFRRTEGLDGPTEFLGFLLNDDGELLDPPEAPERKIEFYGDSITCGMGNEAPKDAPDNKNAERNNYLAYGSITARRLNADFHCIARSGIGVVKSWFDLVMPDYWYRLDPNDPDSEWDFSSWTPDVVVINLFQNDSWLIPKMNPVPTEEEIVDAYADFISKIRDEYPDAHIVCALGCMDATEADSPWPGYIRKAAEKVWDDHISVLVFPCPGWKKHPRVEHHRAMADQLTAHLRDVMDWE